MKKSIMILISLILILSFSIVPATAHDYDELTNADIQYLMINLKTGNEVYLSIDEYIQWEQSRATASVVEPGIACCDNVRKVWDITYVGHEVNVTTGQCVGYAHWGTQYCSTCGSIWQGWAKYQVITPGCGQYH